MLKERDQRLTRLQRQSEEELLRGEWVNSSSEDQPRLQRMVVAFRKNYRKDKILNLRINGIDLDRLKAKAKRSGMKYQTYITSSLHQAYRRS